MPVSRKKALFSPVAVRRRRHLSEIHRMAKYITSQEILDHCLLDVEDVMKRRAMFDLVKPHLKFRPTFPSRLNLPSIVGPGYRTGL